MTPSYGWLARDDNVEWCVDGQVVFWPLCGVPVIATGAMFCSVAVAAMTGDGGERSLQDMIRFVSWLWSVVCSVRGRAACVLAVCLVVLLVVVAPAGAVGGRR